MQADIRETPCSPGGFAVRLMRHRGMVFNTKTVMRQYQSVKTLSAVGDNLRAIRGSLSQLEFAKFLGIPNQVTYHRYENGRVPKAHILQQIAERLGIGVDELLSPISKERAEDIFVYSQSTADPAAADKHELTESTANAIGEASAELVNAKSLKAIVVSFRLEQLSIDQLTRLFSHLVAVSNRAPADLAKYFTLIRCAVSGELIQRMGEKYGFDRFPKPRSDSARGAIPRE